MPPDRPVVTLRLPFGLRTRRPAERVPTAEPEAEIAGATRGSAVISAHAGAAEIVPAVPTPAVQAPRPTAPSPALTTPMAETADSDIEGASSTLVWLAFTSTLSARATTLEDAFLSLVSKEAVAA